MVLAAEPKGHVIAFAEGCGRGAVVAVGVCENDGGERPAGEGKVDGAEMAGIHGAGIDQRQPFVADEKAIGARKGIGRGIGRCDAREAGGESDGRTDDGAEARIECG